MRERLDVRWGAKKQNDTLSRDYNRPNPLFWPFRAGIPVSLHLFLYDAPLARTSRLLTVVFLPSILIPLVQHSLTHFSSSSPHTHSIRTLCTGVCKIRSRTRERYIHVPRGRSEYISSGNTIISSYRGKILVASVDLLAEIRAVTADSYET